MKTVSLTPVRKENWLECSRLSVKRDQKGNVASCLETIAESRFEPHYELRAIELDGRIVGMLAYCPEVDEPVDGLFWIFRLVIGKQFQGKGYGKKAIGLCLSEIRGMGGKWVRTMCKPGNGAAIRCYESLGFKRQGSLDDGDILFEIKFKADKAVEVT
jgi:diamine N-acetyltransferase